MNLVRNPDSSRWFGRNRRHFVKEYGISFWSKMVEALEKHDRIVDLPEKYQVAYVKMRRKVGGFSS